LNFGTRPWQPAKSTPKRTAEGSQGLGQLQCLKLQVELEPDILVQFQDTIVSQKKRFCSEKSSEQEMTLREGNCYSVMDGGILGHPPYILPGIARRHIQLQIAVIPYRRFDF
jgi:hypothetical protein